MPIMIYPVPTHNFHVFWPFLPEACDAVDEAGRFAWDVIGPGREAGGARPGPV